MRAHFLHIFGKGVDPFLNVAEQYDAMRDQERVDVKIPNLSSHASTIGTTTAAQNQNRVKGGCIF